jgi:hypothetical protein
MRLSRERQAEELKNGMFNACVWIMAKDHVLSIADVEFLKYALPLFMDELKSQEHLLKFD